VAVIERLQAEARRQYPNRTAALRAIDVVAASVRPAFPEGLAYETAQAHIAKATDESKALVHLFFAERATRKVPDLPPAYRAAR
jgi:3-hydroxyacyl-CoA dehydrogenase